MLRLLRPGPRINWSLSVTLNLAFECWSTYRQAGLEPPRKGCKRSVTAVAHVGETGAEAPRTSRCDGSGPGARCARAEVRAALAQLPEVEREMITLVAWEELSPAEAATILGFVKRRQGNGFNAGVSVFRNSLARAPGCSSRPSG